MGVHMICEIVWDEVPDDSLTSWVDDSNVRVCIRRRPSEMPRKHDGSNIAELMFGVVAPQKNRSMAIFRMGNCVLVKLKWLGLGGSRREPAAMELIRQKAPSVPIPEPLYDWKDPDWFCYFIIMREIRGVAMLDAWWGLAEEHQQRLLREMALHIKAVGDITSPVSVSADGEPFADGMMVWRFEEYNEDMEPGRAAGPFTPEQLHEYATANTSKRNLQLPPSLGEEFYLCHMDPAPDHFMISDGQPHPPRDKNLQVRFPPERQAGLRVVGIIDWERAGFLPRLMVSWQFRAIIHGQLHTRKLGLPDTDGMEFLDAMVDELVKLGCEDPETCGYRTWWFP